MAVEDDAEEVVGLALMPVVGRIDRGDRGDPGVAVRAGDLDADPTIVGHGLEGVDRVELSSGVAGVVNAIDPHAHLEAQSGLIAQCGSEGKQVLPAHEERDLTAVDDDLLHRRRHGHAAISQGQREFLRGRIEPAAVGRLGRSRHDDGGHQTAEARGVAAVLRGECAVAYADDLKLAHPFGKGGRAGRHLEARYSRRHRVLVAHRSSPRISRVGLAVRAANSAASSARTALTPSFMSWI